MKKMTPDEIERHFWRQVDRRGPDDCWEWQGRLQNPHTRHHYGEFRDNRMLGRSGKIGAHRWIMWNLGHDIQGRWVCHHCDNKRCVNPRHLYVGDRYTNARDWAERNEWFHRVSADQVLEIIERYRPGTGGTNPGNSAELAREYGIAQQTLRWIARPTRSGIKSDYYRLIRQRVDQILAQKNKG